MRVSEKVVREYSRLVDHWMNSIDSFTYRVHLERTCTIPTVNFERASKLVALYIYLKIPRTFAV